MIRGNRREHYTNLSIPGNFADYLPLENGDTGGLESDYIEGDLGIYDPMEGEEE